MEEFQEYYLLYYGEVEWCEEAGEPYEVLTYGISLGDLSDQIAKTIARYYRFNYFDPSGKVTYFQWFDPQEDFKPFFNLRTRQSILGWLDMDYAVAEIRFDEEYEGDLHAKALETMRNAVTLADKLRKKALRQSEGATGKLGDEGNSANSGQSMTGGIQGDFQVVAQGTENPTGSSPVTPQLESDDGKSEKNPKKPKGRPPEPRNKWIIERHKENWSHTTIREKWNKMSDEERRKATETDKYKRPNGKINNSLIHSAINRHKKKQQ